MNSWIFAERFNESRIIKIGNQAFFFVLEMGIVPSTLANDSHIFRSSVCYCVDLLHHKRVVLSRKPKLETDNHINPSPSSSKDRVVPSFFVHRDEDYYYSVSDYIAGGSLCSYLLKNGPLTEKGARTVFRQLLPLLQDRSTPISQSDIRLSNILLRRFNSIHDIVLVPRSQVPTSVNPLNSLVENMEYLSRENILSQPEDLLHNNWSLGVLLYILLTRSFPFGSYKNSNILSNIHNGIFKKDDPAFEKLSVQAKQLIYRFFDCEASKRITLDELIASDFMKIQDSQDEPDFISNWERLTFVGYSLQDSWAFHLVHDVENVQYRILDRKSSCCYSFPCGGSMIHSSLITSDTLMVSEVYSNTDGFWVHVENSCVMNPPNSPYGVWILAQRVFQPPLMVPMNSRLFQTSAETYRVFFEPSRNSFMKSSALCSIIVAECVVEGSPRFIQLSQQSCCASNVNEYVFIEWDESITEL